MTDQWREAILSGAWKVNPLEGVLAAIAPMRERERGEARKDALLEAAAHLDVVREFIAGDNFAHDFWKGQRIGLLNAAACFREAAEKGCPIPRTFSRDFDWAVGATPR